MVTSVDSDKMDTVAPLAAALALAPAAGRPPGDTLAETCTGALIPDFIKILKAGKRITNSGDKKLALTRKFALYLVCNY